MRRKLAALAAVLFLLAACGPQEGNSAPKEPYDKEDVKTLLASGIFSEEPEELDGDVACGLFGVDGSLLQECEVYLPTSTNAEALALFVLNDAGDSEGVKAACEDWLAGQIESYQDYGPEHVPKLEGAVLRVRENTVLLVVGAEPESARTAVDGLDS